MTTTTTTAPHYQLEEHDLNGWQSLGGYHAFSVRAAADSDLRMQAMQSPARFRLRDTTSNRVVGMKNVTAYDEQLNDFRDQAVSLRAEFAHAIYTIESAATVEPGDHRQLESLPRQVEACDALIDAIDRIF